MDCFEINGLFSERQFGFRKGGNTIEVVVDFESSLDLATFIDLTMANECVSRDKL